MRQPDIVLVHPPSVFDFRERAIFYGPIADVIPSSPVFEMYPLGFLTLASYLRRHGYRTRIVNLALLMMRRRGFRPEHLLGRLRPKLFGIDLHWLPHAQGGPAVARLLKGLHPEIPVVFGGISSTYFHEELIRDPAVDFVLRGSVTEPCLLALVRELEGERRFDRVPNLTWKHLGEVRVNPASFTPTSVDDYDYDLGMMVSAFVRGFDLWSAVPFHTWWLHPITAVTTVRGCARECVTCGASMSAFDRFMPGRHPILRSPKAIAGIVRDLALLTRAPIFLIGDLRDGGEAYAAEVVIELGRTRVSNRLVFEFFDPPPAEFLAHIDKSIPHWGAELSPESHDPAVRARLGKASFTNDAMNESLDAMLRLRCEQVDVFYMIGLPEQTHESVMASADAIETLFARFDRRLSAFITPVGPFIDPGSRGFEDAQSQGYRLRARTLAEHQALLEHRDWESILNYETEWMTRTQIVDATYDAAERLNEAKARSGRISPATAHELRNRLDEARALRRRLAAAGDHELDPETHSALLGEIHRFSEGTVNSKNELFVPRAFLRQFRLGGIARLLIRDLVRPRAPRADRRRDHREDPDLHLVQVPPTRR